MFSCVRVCISLIFFQFADVFCSLVTAKACAILYVYYSTGLGHGHVPCLTMCIIIVDVLTTCCLSLFEFSFVLRFSALLSTFLLYVIHIARWINWRYCCRACLLARSFVKGHSYCGPYCAVRRVYAVIERV